MTKNHLRSSVPCLQTSIYRSLWVEYQVHWPLITGCPSGLGSQGSNLQSLPISLYRSPIADAKFTDLSLQITYKEDGKKRCQSQLSSSLFVWVQIGDRVRNLKRQISKEDTIKKNRRFSLSHLLFAKKRVQCTFKYVSEQLKQMLSHDLIFLFSGVN